MRERQKEIAKSTRPYTPTLCCEIDRENTTPRRHCAESKGQLTLPCSTSAREDSACQPNRKLGKVGYGLAGCFPTSHGPLCLYRHKQCQHSTESSPWLVRQSHRHRKGRYTRSQSKERRMGPAANRRYTRAKHRRCSDTRLSPSTHRGPWDCCRHRHARR